MDGSLCPRLQVKWISVHLRKRWAQMLTAPGMIEKQLKSSEEQRGWFCLDGCTLGGRSYSGSV